MGHPYASFRSAKQSRAWEWQNAPCRPLAAGGIVDQSHVTCSPKAVPQSEMIWALLTAFTSNGTASRVYLWKLERRSGSVHGFLASVQCINVRVYVERMPNLVRDNLGTDVKLFAKAAVQPSDRTWAYRRARAGCPVCHTGKTRCRLKKQSRSAPVVTQIAWEFTD